MSMAWRWNKPEQHGKCRPGLTWMMKLGHDIADWSDHYPRGWRYFSRLNRSPDSQRGVSGTVIHFLWWFSTHHRIKINGEYYPSYQELKKRQSKASRGY